MHGYQYSRYNFSNASFGKDTCSRNTCNRSLGFEESSRCCHFRKTARVEYRRPLTTETSERSFDSTFSTSVLDSFRLFAVISIISEKLILEADGRITKHGT